MKLIQVLAVFSCTVLAAHAEIRLYNGYQVIRSRAHSEQQYNSLMNLYNEGTLDFWCGPSLKGYTDILVQPSRISEIKNYLLKNSIPFRVHIEDVEKYLILNIQKLLCCNAFLV